MLYKELSLSKEVQQAIEKMGFTTLTEVQEKAIPLMLAGKEVTAKAPTGTGKTCAFGVPIVERLNAGVQKPMALVLCPTRELCLQIVDELSALCAFKPGLSVVALYGGQPIAKQINALKTPQQIVVATPGRLKDHMQRRTLDLRCVETVVLDEADEMLDMGFYKDVVGILEKLPAKKQVCMFSATISREVMDIGWLYQKEPEEITVEPLQESEPQITQYCIESTGRQRFWDLTTLIRKNGYRRAMVFCNTKYATQSLCDQLRTGGFNADCLHGDMPQQNRNKIMEKFRKGEINILVSTDVAARGIDVPEVEAVFNFELPNENEYYTHRIGRTGRAQREGVSYVLYSKSELARLRNVLKYTRSAVIPLRLNAQGNYEEYENAELATKTDIKMEYLKL